MESEAYCLRSVPGYQGSSRYKLLRGVTTTPFVALAPCNSGENILGPTDASDRSKPPVWHQVAYISEVLGNSVFALELVILFESAFALELTGLFKSVFALELIASLETVFTLEPFVSFESVLERWNGL